MSILHTGQCHKNVQLVSVDNKCVLKASPETAQKWVKQAHPFDIKHAQLEAKRFQQQKWPKSNKYGHSGAYYGHFPCFTGY